MKIKFAVVGCGHIGKRHAEMIKRNSEAELVALIDVKNKDELNIKDLDAPFFNSLQDFFDSGIQAEVINIATPNGYHAEQAITCLNAGLHVVIEKPIALRKMDAEHIIHTALLRNRQVFAVMQNRYSPPTIWLKELIQSKIIGKIFIVQLNCFWNRDHRYYTSGSWHGNASLDGGTLFTQFSHFIDILYFLFGDIKNIVSRVYDFNHNDITDFEDSGFVSFDFVKEGAGIINFSTSVWNENFESTMTIIGEYGTVKIGGQYMNTVEYCNIKNYTMPELPPTNPGNDYGYYKGSAQNHHFVIENVIDVLKNRSTITTNALEGLKVVEMINRIYSSKITF